MRLALFILLGACATDPYQARLRTAVDARQSRLDGCYEKSLERENATPDGKMKLVLHVPKHGNEVEAVDVEKSDMKDKKLQRCVKTALVGVKLGARPDEDLDVEYTLAFRVDTD